MQTIKILGLAGSLRAKLLQRGFAGTAADSCRGRHLRDRDNQGHSPV